MKLYAPTQSEDPLVPVVAEQRLHHRVRLLGLGVRVVIWVFFTMEVLAVHLLDFFRFLFFLSRFNFFSGELGPRRSLDQINIVLALLTKISEQFPVVEIINELLLGLHK